MRSPVSPPIVFALASLAVGAFAVPASAQAPEAPRDACKESLDRSERKSYQFKKGRRVWGPGRVIVTPTKANGDRYCVQARFGGRSVFVRGGSEAWERRNGRWVRLGEDGSGGDVSPSYTSTLEVAERRRVKRRLEVRIRGEWYRVVFYRQNL